eukprot:gnl/TRDRNA2_/TRDRNA2_156194_c0_seq1.p4 gnl/TRDRNA2_/TRDRNA2_156194_c0~~gnl/TRDRNA2_/TRDRNA2_156194_c0_seq1.p4  ORF type:complete len:106 (+),score=12.94 gnl/TRDRNA2_/TRDRNA2_156194_c0_seq1:479-796(+)
MLAAAAYKARAASLPTTIVVTSVKRAANRSFFLRSVTGQSATVILLVGCYTPVSPAAFPSPFIRAAQHMLSCLDTISTGETGLLLLGYCTPASSKAPTTECCLGS